jgi:hypothetical protein
MRLTKKKAIDISIELWTWLAETGKKKYEWDGWEQYGEMYEGCALCEYSHRQSGRVTCSACSYYECFNNICFSGDTNYRKWASACQKRTRMKYAKLFLKELYQLKEHYNG